MKNWFHLRFDARILVKCYNDSNLQEWCSLEPNRTDAYDLSTWNMVMGLVLSTNETLYIRRSDLKRKVLNIATVEVSYEIICFNLHSHFQKINSEMCAIFQASSLLKGMNKKLTGFFRRFDNCSTTIFYFHSEPC